MLSQCNGDPAALAAWNQFWADVNVKCAAANQELLRRYEAGVEASYRARFAAITRRLEAETIRLASSQPTSPILPSTRVTNKAAGPKTTRENNKRRASPLQVPPKRRRRVAQAGPAEEQGSHTHSGRASSSANESPLSHQAAHSLLPGTPIFPDSTRAEMEREPLPPNSSLSSSHQIP